MNDKYIFNAMGILILFLVWASGIVPAWIWIRKNTDIDKFGCSIMSIGSWGLALLWIADIIYKRVKYGEWIFKSKS